MKTGVNTSTIINIKKKRTAWLKKGKGNCLKCKHLAFGYYCNRKKESAVHVGKPNQCKLFVKKDLKK